MVGKHHEPRLPTAHSLHEKVRGWIHRDGNGRLMVSAGMQENRPSTCILESEPRFTLYQAMADLLLARRRRVQEEQEQGS
jgi:hypothetical protein